MLGFLVQERSRLFTMTYTVLIRSILHGEPTSPIGTFKSFLQSWHLAEPLRSFLFVFPRWFWCNPTFLLPSRPLTGSPSCMRDGKFHLIAKLGFYNETEESFNILTLPFVDCNGLIDKFFHNGQIFIKSRQAHQSIHVLALFHSLDSKNLAETVVSPNSWAVRINPELSAFVQH